jgi:hypothetical protein
MDLRVFQYNVGGVFSSFGWPYQVKSLAKLTTTTILKNLANGSAPIIKLKAAFVDDRAQLHCDKWIEETAIHMSLYSAAQEFLNKPKLSVTASTGGLPSALKRLLLRYKAFSGDVSGVIGEAIFSSLLVQHYGLTDTDFAHFRADKLSGIFPDFGIFRLSISLENSLIWNGTPLRTSGPGIPAEVKTVSFATTGDIRAKLRRAIEQVQNFWIRVNSGGFQNDEAAIICLVIRNQQRAAYDVALIWAR